MDIIEPERTPAKLLKLILPRRAHAWLRARRRESKHLGFKLRGGFGALRKLRPVSADWGESRGTTIDRYYIEQFLALHAQDIRGHVLEFCDNAYSDYYGGERVTQIDILHHVPGNPLATIVADLTDARDIPSNTFDCIICTQVLPLIYEVRKAVQTLHRILKPGGVALVTAPGVAQKIDRYAMEEGGDYWRFTSLSIRCMFEEVFGDGCVNVKTHGNVLAAIAYLSGLAVEELQPEEMDHLDRDYEISITLRAVKQIKS